MWECNRIETKRWSGGWAFKAFKSLKVELVVLEALRVMTAEKIHQKMIFQMSLFYVLFSSSAVYRSLTFKRSVQHGIAAKMSNEYIVPIKRADPSHLSAQKLW